jgi:NADH:ubiquinone oxidoreductase subunit 3 (subunit A)
MIEIMFTPLITFLITLVIISILYLFAGTLGPKYKKAKYKLQSYACGEDYPGGKLQESYNFFHVAFFFTILHVGVLLIATAPSGQPAILGFLLIGVMTVIALALFFGGRDHD